MCFNCLKYGYGSEDCLVELLKCEGKCQLRHITIKCRGEIHQVTSGGDKTDKQAPINSKVECNLTSLSPDPQKWIRIIKLKFKLSTTKVATPHLDYESADQQNM